MSKEISQKHEEQPTFAPSVAQSMPALGKEDHLVHGHKELSNTQLQQEMGKDNGDGESRQEEPTVDAPAETNGNKAEASGTPVPNIASDDAPVHTTEASPSAAAIPSVQAAISSPPSSAPAAPPPAAAIDTSYRLKRITYLDPRTNIPRQLQILTQNANGPCPLIALCNVLLLRGDIEINGTRSEVDFEYIAQLIGEWVMCRLPDTSPTANGPPEMSTETPGESTAASPSTPRATDFSQNLTDVLHLIPTLQKGLDVNVRFDTPFAFEVTPALLIFDLFRITLCHGWTVDPQDEETYRVVVGECGSYNAVVERIVAGDAVADGKGDNTNSPAPAPAPPTPETLHTALVCQSFLTSTASQLTYHGLQSLTDSLPPNSLSVLFRNNHFATLYKRVHPPPVLGKGKAKDEGNGEPQTTALYTLITDQGFADVDGAVWETMDAVDGDSAFLDGFFQPFHHTQHAGHVPLQQGEDGVADGGGGEGNADLALAMALQREEDEAAASSQQFQQQQQQAQQRQRQDGSQRKGQSQAKAQGRGGKQQEAPKHAGQAGKKDKCSVM
ncbi:uncharacterized protein EV422DRAFT_513067 [Fimicolochytrium jonesii]|uniref:uncharacterized protein n=1 Tax=Fimicolochytrium jonesii TaxID=1396493 RepID=UPI0022FE866B|nr:uncharacterized protein EV422DRAFT_513067 [Fimicolochytrium jonesii]KAI8827217.1 hypothetical protein EV422DRAFT_513067 [Fimicolochytrium jonesii]